jgi:dienelactone hydrolase
MPSLEAQSTAVAIPAERIRLRGRLLSPAGANGVVLFAHGGGSSRHGPRNHRIAEALHDVGLATLLLDFLPETGESAQFFDGRLRNDVALHVDRLRAATQWIRQLRDFMELPVGYFGAGQGASAVLLAAASDGSDVQAVVTRGGRLDSDDMTIQKVRAPTLLIVGGNDDHAAAANLEAWARMRCEKSFEVIPGAGPLFDEPGALDNVSALAARWFGEHLRKRANIAA